MFLGTVVAVTDLARTDVDTFLTSRRARFQVNESFGGLSSDLREVDVLTGVGGGDCGIPFQAGEVYLIDAFIGEDGFIHAGICSSTRRIDAVGAALRILRQRRDGQRVPSLAGQIAQHDRNFKGKLGTHTPRPLANTLVRVKTDGRVYETRADAEGLYALYNLPSGRYELIPDLPQGTTLPGTSGVTDRQFLLSYTRVPVESMISRFSQVDQFRVEFSTLRISCCLMHSCTSSRLTRR